MRRKKRILTIILLLCIFFALPISVSANAQTGITKTGAICPQCYNNRAKVICNKDYMYEGTYFHGSCPYNLFTCTVSVQCDQCNDTFLLDEGRHLCRESHTGCSLGVISICGIT